MAANIMDELLKEFPDLEEGWKEMEERFKKDPAEREMLSLKYQQMLERERNLPEQEFTKAKRAEPAYNEKAEINSLDKAALEYHRKVMEYEYKTGLKLANMTSFKDGIEWLARKIIEVIDAQGDNNLETIGTIEAICKIKIKQNSKK